MQIVGFRFLIKKLDSFSEENPGGTVEHTFDSFEVLGVPAFCYQYVNAKLVAGGQFIELSFPVIDQYQTEKYSESNRTKAGQYKILGNLDKGPLKTALSKAHTELDAGDQMRSVFIKLEHTATGNIAKEILNKKVSTQVDSSDAKKINDSGNILFVYRRQKETLLTKFLTKATGALKIHDAPNSDDEGTP